MSLDHSRLTQSLWNLETITTRALFKSVQFYILWACRARHRTHLRTFTNQFSFPSEQVRSVSTTTRDEFMKHASAKYSGYGYWVERPSLLCLSYETISPLSGWRKKKKRGKDSWQKMRSICGHGISFHLVSLLSPLRNAQPRSKLDITKVAQRRSSLAWNESH